ncbi:myelin-oligodendrocyte glycoprotein-like [Hoplias malabaricus]|uniref:myelin-oligodendrocyte glycoprotein-like n=1 Tax=Hoplias malabaricus TaxID=27720 RepID=UPI003461B01C
MTTMKKNKTQTSDIFSLGQVFSGSRTHPESLGRGTHSGEGTSPSHGIKFLIVTAVIFSAFMETRAEEFNVVAPDASLTVKVGEDLVLPCFLQPKISAVDMTVKLSRQELNLANRLVHLYEGYKDKDDQQGESYRGRRALFKEELKRGNTSLKLSTVQFSDKGLYQCYVKDKTAYWEDTTIHVEVTEHFKVIGPDAPLIVKVGEDLVLPCSLQHNISAVDKRVKWSRQGQADSIVHLYDYNKDRNDLQMESYRGRTSLFKEELKNGNISLKLSAVEFSDDGVYKCYVEDTSTLLYEGTTVRVGVTTLIQFRAAVGQESTRNHWAQGRNTPWRGCQSLYKDKHNQ